MLLLGNSQLSKFLLLLSCNHFIHVPLLYTTFLVSSCFLHKARWQIPWQDKFLSPGQLFHRTHHSGYSKLCPVQAFSKTLWSFLMYLSHLINRLSLIMHNVNHYQMKPRICYSTISQFQSFNLLHISKAESSELPLSAELGC